MQVDHAFHGGPDLEVLVKAFNTDITRRDLKVSSLELKPLKHVTDGYFFGLSGLKSCLLPALPYSRPYNGRDLNLCHVE